MLTTAQSYLISYVLHPMDKCSDLMPADARWMRATRRLYAKLSPAEQDTVKNYASKRHRHEQARAVKKIAQKLLVEAGMEGENMMIYLEPGEGASDEN